MYIAVFHCQSIQSPCVPANMAWWCSYRCIVLANICKSSSLPRLSHQSPAAWFRRSPASDVPDRQPPVSLPADVRRFTTALSAAKPVDPASDGGSFMQKITLP